MATRYDGDPYAVLGLPHNASDAEIKRIYHRLARQYHPDLNKDPRAAERMKEINWAYAILGDRKERFAYDLWRDTASRANANPGATSAQTSSSPPRQTVWTNSPPAKPRSASSTIGCSAVWMVWLIFMVISNLLRNTSVREPQYVVPSNSYTQTALAENLYETLLLFLDTPTVSSLGLTSVPFYVNTMQAAYTQTAIAESRNIRDKILPGSPEWEWIEQFFPQYGLTTSEGLSDEVTFMYWDQSRDAYIIETRQHGTLIISFFNNSVSAGVLIPPAPTPSP